jgi:hypothetical protein
MELNRARSNEFSRFAMLHLLLNVTHFGFSKCNIGWGEANGQWIIDDGQRRPGEMEQNGALWNSWRGLLN